MTVRRALLWLVANLALILVTSAAFLAWLMAARATDLTGASASARSVTIPVGALLVVVLGTLLVANLAWMLLRRR